jgi:hypothetical protein
MIVISASFEGTSLARLADPQDLDFLSSGSPAIKWVVTDAAELVDCHWAQIAFLQ